MIECAYMKNINYVPETCGECKQTTTYVLAIDKGTVHIVKQIARFIGKKGINAVHPRKEMEGTYLSSNEVGNLTRPRAHGLIAKIKGNAGNYCLTSKGAAFLHGQPIERYAIRSKTLGKTIGYVEGHNVTISEFNAAGDMWEGVGYGISEGNVITSWN
jgi:hypothetical protein